MINKVKVIVLIIMIGLLLFLIFSNFRNVSDSMRELPSEEELNEFNSVSSKNEVNTYEVKDISNEQLATIYYSDFKNEVVNFPDDIYSKIRNKSDITSSVFESFRNELINNYYSNTVSSYNFRNTTNGKILEVTNNYNQKITFYIDSVLNYEIELTL